MPNTQYEAELIAGCLRNDPRSQELLFKHFHGYSFSLCMRYLGNKSDATEVMNDSFFKALTKIQKYDPQKSFRAWLRRILLNGCIDCIRNKNKFSVSFEDSIIVESGDDTDMKFNGLSAEDILKLLSKLPDKYRVVFNLYEIEGFSHEEIAEMMKIQTSTSRGNLTRAKQKLRELLLKHHSYAKF